MAIFYTDSGSFNDITVTGSLRISGSLTLQSTQNFNSTGSVYGTASWAVSSSRAISASYAPTILPSGVVSSSLQINTGSFSGSFTGTLIGTSSWASNVVSASFATTALTASFVSGTINFPNGLDVTGSLTVSGSITGSLLGTASWAVSASWAPGGPGGGVTSITAGDGLSGGTITSTGTIALDTGSLHFISGSQKVTSSRAISSSYADSLDGYVNFPSGLIVTGSTILSGSTQITGSLSVSAGITGSFANFNPVSLKITVGTTAPSGPSVNDLWVDTN